MYSFISSSRNPRFISRIYMYLQHRNEYQFRVVIGAERLLVEGGLIEVDTETRDTTTERSMTAGRPRGSGAAAVGRPGRRRAAAVPPDAVVDGGEAEQAERALGAVQGESRELVVG